VNGFPEAFCLSDELGQGLIIVQMSGEVSEIAAKSSQHRQILTLSCSEAAASVDIPIRAFFLSENLR
jgi:hypothetical protein